MDSAIPAVIDNLRVNADSRKASDELLPYRYNIVEYGRTLNKALLVGVSKAGMYIDIAVERLGSPTWAGQYRYVRWTELSGTTIRVLLS